MHRFGGTDLIRRGSTALKYACCNTTAKSRNTDQRTQSVCRCGQGDQVTVIVKATEVMIAKE
jgi:hypothetical protein